MKTKVKICGITREDDALLAEKLGADFIGFIFSKYSKRQVHPDQAEQMISKLTTAKPVGVFVEQDLEETLSIARQAGLYGIQHHGFFEEGIKDFFYIHTVPVSDQDLAGDIFNISAPDAFLCDTKVKGQYGGTGQSFDWSILPEEQIHKIIIAGGVGAHNISDILKTGAYAADLSSSVESAPGIKDHHKLREFFKEYKDASQT